MKKRIFALLLVCAMLLPALVACGKTGGGETTTSPTDTTGGETDNPYDENGFLKDDIPDVDYKKADVNVVYWKEHEMPEYDVEYASEMKPVEAALYTKNNRVQTRLNIKLNYIPVKKSEMQDHLKTAARSDNSDNYDIISGYSLDIGQIAMAGLGVNLKNYPVLGLDKPWWSQDLLKSCTIGNGLYYASGDISTNLLYMMNCTFFDKGLITSYSLENPYDLVGANQWTQSKMFDMCANLYEDLNDNDKQDDSDVYGLTLRDLNLDALFYGAGLMIVDNVDGAPKLNEDYLGEKCRDWIVACVENFKQKKDCYYTDDIQCRDIFGAGRALFLVDSPFCVDETLNNYEDCDNYGIVPVPKWDSTQENYRSGMRFYYSLYTLFAPSHNLSRAATVMECMASENYRIVTPELFETTMKYQYALEDTASQMFDIIRANIVYDFARDMSDSFSLPVAQYVRNKVKAGSVDWISYIGRLKPQLDGTLGTIVSNFKKNNK